MTKPQIADRKPKILKLDMGKTYWWCQCGKSAKQPFCDGSHKDTPFEPVEFTCKREKPVALCLCKQTKTPPYCDGTHSKLS
ncbi:CDGSH iron-sulfur domain-containing protein [Sneathiella glossodoripedis]|uniref:CDGSH iron-sulfur domain-containing protein n=1 Tax=Sneathiella glossodoripedis TaxID=418853 RepID=UPI000A015196|nr:CDGSH iron-sulfur domain-containing protein [Sneathiella glossodoripedis]